MMHSEALYPAAARLGELCTNGLFLNLRGFPEPLRLCYQQLRTRIREEALPGACLLLAEMAGICIRFPLLAACSLALHAEAPLSDKKRALGLLNDSGTLAGGLREFFRAHPQDVGAHLLDVADDALRTFSAEPFTGWLGRATSGAYLEMRRTEAASSLLAQLTSLNGHLQRAEGFYALLRDYADEDGRSFRYLEQSLRPDPFILFQDRDILLAEHYDTASGKVFFRSPVSGYLTLMDIPELTQILRTAEDGSAVEEVPTPDAFPEYGDPAQLESVHQPSDYIRPGYLDQWLSRGLAHRDHGYLYLEMEEGMGKSSYVAMLDPDSPYYTPTTLFANYHIIIHTMTIAPQTWEGRALADLLNGLEGAPRPLIWTDSVADMRRALAEWLHDYAAAHPERKLLIILDGLQYIERPTEEGLLTALLPRAGQLPPGVCILLTDRPDPEAAVHAAWLHRLDPEAVIGVFKHDHPQYQQLFRVYLTQYLLHASGEDNPLVTALGEYLQGDFAMAHTLRDVYYLCRPDPHTSVRQLAMQFPTQEDLLHLYLDRVHALYGPKWGIMLDEMLVALAMLPRPATQEELFRAMPDHPSPEAFYSLLRDLRPFIYLTAGRRITFSGNTALFFIYSYLAADWKLLCERILDERRLLLGSAPDAYALPERLQNLPVYAASVPWDNHRELLIHLGRSLAPKASRSDSLPSDVLDYYNLQSGNFRHEGENPLRLETIAALSLSPDTNDRLTACRRMDSLRGTIHYDRATYELYCRRYEERLAADQPLSAAVITALAAFRRKNDYPKENAFLWHTEYLSRGALYEALKNESARLPGKELSTADPREIAYVREKYPQLADRLQALISDYDAAPAEPRGIAALQEAAVLSHQMMSFGETALVTLLPVLCIRDAQPETGAYFGVIRDTLNRVYQLRQEIFARIEAYGAALRPETDYREPLYAPDTREIRRRDLLARDLFQWLMTFTRYQRMQYYADRTPDRRLVEALLRLNTPGASPSGESVNLRTVRSQIDALEPEAAYALADRWVRSLTDAYSVIRGPIPAARAGDLAAALLKRADTAVKLLQSAPTEELRESLHADVERLRFLLGECDLSSRRALETAGSLAADLLPADEKSIFANSKELVDEYQALNASLQKARSFFSSKQIDQVLDQFRDGFLRCLRRHHFYSYLIPAEARLDAVENGPLACRMRVDESTDPADKITAYLSLITASPEKDLPRGELQVYLQELVTKQASDIPAELLDYCMTLGLEQNHQNPAHQLPYTGGLYPLWLHLGAPDPAQAGLDGRIPAAGRQIYRRLSASFVVEDAPIHPEKLRVQVQREDSDPLHQAFAYLCLAITAGGRTLSRAAKLLEMAESALAASPDPAPELALALIRTRIILHCLDEASSPEALSELLDEYRERTQTAMPGTSPEAVREAMAKLPVAAYARLWQTTLRHQIPPALARL
ncbi:MAG: hypothetical protein IJM90_08095 [Firmicutes bacterium]|nr:hypothetical protein [Bacillota bacterium]